MPRTQEDFALLPAGDGTLTKRVLKRCRDAGIAYSTETVIIKIGRNRYGTKTTGYMVPKHILDEVRSRREDELSVIEQKKAIKRAIRIEEIRISQLNEMAAKFPHLPSAGQSHEKTLQIQRF